MSFYPSKISKEEREAMVYQLQFIAAKHGLKTKDLEDAMMYETAGTMDPSIKNPNSSGSGLIQFMESTANDLGTTTSELREMSGPDQLFYVDKYLDKNLKGKTSFEDLYTSIAGAKYVGKPSSTIMYKKGSLAVKKNPGWDVNKDGKITKGEAAKAAKKSSARFKDSVFYSDQQNKDKKDVVDYFKKKGVYKKYKNDGSLRKRIQKGIEMTGAKRDIAVGKDLPIKNQKQNVIMSLEINQRKPASVKKTPEVKKKVKVESTSVLESIIRDRKIPKKKQQEKKEVKVESTNILESVIKDRKVPKKKEEFKGSFYDRKVLEAKARNVSRSEKKRLNEENVRKLSELGELGIRN